MRRFVWVLWLAALPALKAQQPADSGARPEAAEAGRLREQIRQRWNAHVRATLGLSDAQAAKLQETERRFEERRAPIRARQRAVNRELEAELASGSPNEQRVSELMNERDENRRKLLDLDRSEDQEMQGYLSPAQRARYQAERQRLRERVAELLRQRREQRPGVPPGRGVPRRRPRP
jgi:Spy/CpxP family protein refolding chaperone